MEIKLFMPDAETMIIFFQKMCVLSAVGTCYVLTAFLLYNSVKVCHKSHYDLETVATNIFACGGSLSVLFLLHWPMISAWIVIPWKG